MRRMSKTIITLMTLVFTVSLIGHVWGDLGYETVGGEISPINFITTFLVPALVILGIFGALIILGVIHIKFKTDANETA